MLKKVLFTLLFVLALAAFAVLLLSQKPAVVQTFRLADGTVVTFGGVTYATNSTFVWGTPFQKWLSKTPLKSWSRGVAIANSTSDTNNPVFWVHVSKQPQVDLTIRMLDEYGSEYDPESYSMGSASLPGGDQLRHHQVEIYGPHGRIIGVRFYEDTAKTQKAGQFLMPGEALLPMPDENSSLSATQEAGGLVFQLTGLVTGLTSVGQPYGPFTNNFPFTQAAFHVTRAGKRAPEWIPAGIKLTDRDGKSRRTKISHRANRSEAVLLEFDGTLDPAAAPWKLDVQFVHWSNFSSNELVTVPHVPFPALGETNQPNINVEIQGETISIEAIYAAGSERPAKTFTSGQPMIEASISPASNGIHLQLNEVVDEQGKALSLGGYAPQGKGKYFFGFQRTASAKFVDLHFAVHSNLYVSFEATPVLFSTNAVVKK